MRICIIYDGIFPNTLGGADRWYRNLAEHLAALGHDVTYATTRQWTREGAPDIPGVRVVAIAPNLRVGDRYGRRQALFPILFGAGVFRHLLVRGRAYDVVHMAAFPYSSLLAAALVRRLWGYRLIGDWHE